MEWDRHDETVLSVLGGFRLSINDRLVSMAMREMRVLALLAVQGPSPRDFISGTLWPDTTQERAAASLRVAVHTIRQTVPDLLDVHRCAIDLRPEVTTDLTLLRDCLSGAASNSWNDRAAALRVLSRGELLPGWRDDWVVHERERLRQRRIRALAALAQSCLDAQDGQTALAAARAAERIEPLRERTQRLAVQALMMLGRPEEARELHGRFVALLNRELGIGPSDQFISLVPAG